MYLYGRRKIYTSVEITEANVITEVNKALAFHNANINEEDYLFWYRRGVQPILERTKEIRPEICNRIVVNNASQIVTFKNGYLMTSPASYVGRDAETEKVAQFNEWVHNSGKAQADNRTVDNFHTMGLGAIFVAPNDSRKKPFVVHALDPRSAFVAYSLAPGNEPVMGLYVTTDEQHINVDVYTRYYVFRLASGRTGTSVTDCGTQSTHPFSILSVEANLLGEIPIIEYQYDYNRMSAFEVGIPIMDEINNIESNRADGVEQAVQQLCVAYNCNFDDDVTANDIRQAGMLCLRSVGENRADFKILDSSLDQNATQTTLNSLYEQLLDKVGLPSVSRGDGGSSDNGSAVYLKSGYSIADTHRRNSEELMRESDERFKKVALKILKQKFGFGLEAEDIELNIEPPSMSNLLVKTQAALNMKQLGLAPQIWLERSGLSSDPLKDIEVSRDTIFADKKEEPKEGEAVDDDKQIEEAPSVKL